MALRRKPHSVTVYSQEEVLDGNTISGYADDGGTAVAGQMTPSDSTTIYSTYGVEAKRAWIFMGDTGDADSFEEGGRIAYDGRRFAILGGPLAFAGFGSADHFSVPLEELLP